MSPHYGLKYVLSAIKSNTVLSQNTPIYLTKFSLIFAEQVRIRTYCCAKILFLLIVMLPLLSNRFSHISLSKKISLRYGFCEISQYFKKLFPNIDHHRGRLLLFKILSIYYLWFTLIDEQATLMPNNINIMLLKIHFIT